MTVIARLGSLQFDPLEVPGARNQDLVLHARIHGYRREWCDGLLYAPKGERRLFEAYNKSLNILPVDELRYYRLAWHRAKQRYDHGIFAERAKSVRAIVDRIRKEGPLSSSAFKATHAGHVDWHWAPTAEGRAILEALFAVGRVGIASRDGSRRTFDLIERLFPEELLAERAPRAEQWRHRLLSRHRGHGLLGPGASSEVHLATGTSAERAKHLRDLVERGALIPAEVEGVKGTRYVVAEERALLDDATHVAPHVTFLAPLDPLVWDRKLLRALFDFDYIWEVYTPEHKRQHGYYVLPLLFGERLVGRIEPRLDRKTRTLDILGVWFEKGFDPLAAPFVTAFAEALDAYVRFVGAEKITWARSKTATALKQKVAAETRKHGEGRATAGK